MKTTINNLHTALSRGVVRVTFTKVDGTRRVMHATTKEGLFNYTPAGEAHAPNPNVTVMWDMDKGAFRSMRNDSLVSFEAE
jgi:WYL_2, Sm-like SH3 beta-barrel fold